MAEEGGAAAAAHAAAVAAAAAAGDDADEALSCHFCAYWLDTAVVLSCGHSMCAGCASQYFARLRRRGQPPACPSHCVPPPRIVVRDRALRERVEARRAAGGAAMPAVVEPQIDPLVPLDDAHLPYDLVAERALGGAAAAAQTVAELAGRGVAAARFAAVAGAVALPKGIALVQANVEGGMRAQLAPLLRDTAVALALIAERPDFPDAEQISLALGTIGAVTALVTSDAAAVEVHWLGGTAGLESLMRHLDAPEQAPAEAQPLCLAAMALLAAPATRQAGGLLHARQAFLELLRADEELKDACVSGMLNAVERYPRSGQVQADALAALTALLSPVPGVLTTTLRARGLGLALDALVNHPCDGVVAEHALWLPAFALALRDSRERNALVKELVAARPKLPGAESFAAIVVQVIHRLRAPARQQDRAVLAAACFTLRQLFAPPPPGSGCSASRSSCPRPGTCATCCARAWSGRCRTRCRPSGRCRRRATSSSRCGARRGTRRAWRSSSLPSPCSSQPALPTRWCARCSTWRRTCALALAPRRAAAASPGRPARRGAWAGSNPRSGATWVGDRRRA